MRKNSFNRILKLENDWAKACGYSLHGTSLSRSLAPKEGVMWTLGIGPMGLPKTFFNGDTIDECLEKAEKAVINGQVVPPTVGGVLSAVIENGKA